MFILKVFNNQNFKINFSDLGLKDLYEIRDL